MTIEIIRAPYFYKYHVIYTEDVLAYGMEKACILGNIDKFDKKIHKEYHDLFPYIEKDKFYNHLNELIEYGKLILVNESDELEKEPL